MTPQRERYFRAHMLQDEEEDDGGREEDGDDDVE